ncbi:MAG: hypothetical protein ACE5IT_07265 [bacterium]
MSVETNAFLNVLLKENLITEKQLNDAKDKQVGAKKPIQELLVEMGFIKEEDLIKISSKVFDMPVLDLGKEEIDPSATKLISCDVAKRYGIFPVRKEKDTLLLAMSNPQDIIALDDIKIMTNMKIKPILSTKSDIANFIEKYYQLDDTLYDLLKNIVDDTKIELVREAKAEQEVFEAETLKGNRSPVVRLANLILGDAVRGR